MTDHPESLAGSLEPPAWQRRFPPNFDEDPVPFAGDVEDWLIRLVISSPIDDERGRSLDEWRTRSEAEHARVTLELMDAAAWFPEQLARKPPLEQRFPKRGPRESAVDTGRKTHPAH